MIKSRILDFSCSSFRNYKFIKFSPQKNFIIISGNNGIGKTNILEAISLLCPGKGLRNAPLQEMCNLSLEDTPWTIEAMVRGLDGDTEVKMQFFNDSEQQAKRQIYANQLELKKQSLLTNISSISWIVPQMDGIFLRGTSIRRKLLDKLTGNFHNNYHDNLNKYEHYLRERSNLLKHHKADQDWLTIIEKNIAQYAVIIAAARTETISVLQNVLNAIDYNLPKIELSIDGEIEQQILNTPALQLEENFANLLRVNRDLDALSKRTNVGVHRSDLVVINKTKNITAAMCSTGEQKILLLAVFLAEVLTFIETRGVVPILLLDDIMSYLDKDRRYMLYTIIRDIGAQAWITGTDKEHFAFMAHESDMLEIQNDELRTMI